LATAPFGGVALPRGFDQDLPHQPRSHPQEMGAQFSSSMSAAFVEQVGHGLRRARIGSSGKKATGA
jgi:hypothetical protein